MACKNGSAALDPILFLNSAFCAKREHDRVKIGCHRVVMNLLDCPRLDFPVNEMPSRLPSVVNFLIIVGFLGILWSSNMIRRVSFRPSSAL